MIGQGVRPVTDTSSYHQSSNSEMVAAAISAFDDVLIAFSLEDLSFVWMSEAARRLFSTQSSDPLKLSASDPVFADLAPVLAALDQGSATSPGPDTESPDLTVQGRQFRSRVVSLHAGDQMPGTLVVRLNEAAPVMADMQAYLLEREKLFTTSRTISVSEMATTLAHEINQPIGSIANILNGARARLENTDCDESVPAALGRALEQTQFATRIIARIRDFTQSRQPVRVDCDLKTLIVESVQLLDWVLAKSGTSVEMVIPSQTVTVNGDATMLQQVFTNLIRNAVDAMIDAPVSDRDLTITLSTQDATARIDFDDSGHGLSNTAKENLFVPFVTQKAQGMGVGLNICRSFVELHQGRLWLAPNNHGGCTACVVLPALTHCVDPVHGRNNAAVKAGIGEDR